MSRDPSIRFVDPKYIPEQRGPTPLSPRVCERCNELLWTPYPNMVYHCNTRASQLNGSEVEHLKHLKKTLPYY